VREHHLKDIRTCRLPDIASSVFIRVIRISNREGDKDFRSIFIIGMDTCLPDPESKLPASCRRGSAAN
jgi:hypothetical protein